MKLLFFLLLGAFFGSTGCTYNITQQQNGKAGSQLAVVGGGENGVTAVQSTGSITPYPLSIYPEYNGYPGSGRRLQSFPPPSTYRYPSGNRNDPSRGYYDSDGSYLGPPDS